MFNKQFFIFLLILLCPVLVSLQAQAAEHEVLNDLPLEGRYAVSAAIGRDRPGFHARMTVPAAEMDNAGHGLLARFTAAGAALTADGGSFSLRPVAWGYGADLAALPAGLPRALDNMVVLERGALAEWYVNGPLGLQQGFTVPEPPQPGDGPLTIALALDGITAGALDADGCGVMLTGADTRLRYRYRGLVVRDSAGRPAPAWLEAKDAGLRICVADAGLAYPLYIDPVIQMARLTASDGSANDYFGYSVAVGSDTVVVGAAEADVDAKPYQGAAYVFVMPGDGWAGNLNETAKLTASDGAADHYFGSSVAVSGDTVVVGAYGVDAYIGAAYVFVKPGGGWAGNLTETAKLTASDGAAMDRLGIRVAVNIETVVAGAFGDDTNRGSAYVFVKPESGWADMTETAKLTASDGEANDNFGISIAVSNDTVVAGAKYDDIDANSVQGSAYVFVRPGGGWATMTETAKLTASDGAAVDYFGCSVAVSVDTVVAGAVNADIGANNRQGAAYVFVKPGGGWADNLTETSKLTASDGEADDFFGDSVAVSADTVAVGVRSDDIDSNNEQGSAYVFIKPESGWAGHLTETAKLTASDGAAGDCLGWSVAVSGDTVVAGALGPGSYSGAAYVFKVIADEPLAAPTGITFTDITAASMTVNWTQGSGTGRLVVMCEAGPVDAAPADGITYAASTAFGTGSQLGTGNYAVYNGGGEFVTVTGLSPATAYHVAIYEYATNPPYEAVNYLATAATGSAATKAEPVARGDSYATQRNSMLSVAAPGVLDNDTDPDGGALSAALVATTDLGTLALAADGSFTYTPDAGFSGVDSFTYRVTNGIDASEAATVYIAVDNDAPVAETDTYTTAKSTTLSVAADGGVLANDTDSDGDSLTAALASSPAHGEVALNADGSFLYVPESGYSGTDSFTYTASDGVEASSLATVTITVTSHAIASEADSYATAFNTPLRVAAAAGVLANDTDELSHDLAAMLVTGPDNGAIGLNADGSFLYIPDAGYAGQDSFTYKASDGTEDSAPATVSITVGRDYRLTVSSIRKFLSFVFPFRIISLSVPAGDEFPADAEITWGTDALKTIRIKTTDQLHTVMVLVLCRSLKLARGEYSVGVGGYEGMLQVQ